MKKCRYCNNEDSLERMFLSAKGFTPELDWYQCWECEYREMRYFGLYNEADTLHYERTGKLSPDHADRCNGCALCERSE